MEFLKPKHDETHEINQPIRNFLNELLPPMVEDMIEKEKTHLSVIRDNE